MSAYIVEDRTINVIVSHLHLNRDLDWLRREFCECAHATKDIDAGIGNALFAMNVAAVEARYGEGEARKFRPLDYSFRLEPATPLAVYHAIAELMYQSCEGSVPETPLYKRLIELKLRWLTASSRTSRQIATTGTSSRELLAAT